MFEEMNSRRQILKKVSYVAPVIATLTVMPAIASVGSAKYGPDCPPGFQKYQKPFDNDNENEFTFSKIKHH